MIDREHVKGFFIGAAVAAILVTGATAFAEPPPATLRPNAGATPDGKALHGAVRLFKVEDCEVWGFSWKGQDRVVAICPSPQKPVPAPVAVPETKPAAK